MSGDDPRLRDDVRAVADWFELGADPEEEVVARLEARMGRRHVPAAALVAVLSVVVLAAIGVRLALPGAEGGQPTMPELVGLYRSIEPDASGSCVAVRLYDTTSDDGRVALWTWTAADPGSCEARRSNLAAGAGNAEAIRLAPRDGSAARDGIRVVAAPGTAPPLAGLALVLDPLAAAAGSGEVPGYWATDEVSGPPTLHLTGVEKLEVPYRPG